MYIHKLAAAAASKPVVTSTATLLLDLIATAGSAAHGIPGTANAVDLLPEDGDVRLFMDGNTPTSTNGLLLKQGTLYALRNVPLTKIMLIRTSGSNVTCSVQVGQSTPDEVTAFSSPGVTASVSVTADTEFPAASADGDNFSNPTTTSIKALGYVWDGAAWDRLPGNSTDGVKVNLGADNDVTVTGTVTEANSAAILAATDGLETAMTAANASLDAIEASAAASATAAHQVTQNGYLDGLEALLTTIDTDTGNIDTSLNNIEADADDLRKALVGPATAPTIDSYTSAAISAAANTADQSLIAAPGASKQIWVYGFQATSTLAGSMSLQDEDNTALSGVMPFGATGGICIPPSGNFAMPLFKVATNKALEIDTVTGDAKGIIQYAIVSV